MRSKFICAMVLAGAVALAPLLAQDDAATENDPYKLCVAKIKDAPLQAYNPCNRYLEQASPDDAERIAHVRMWIARYKKVLLYVQFLQELTPDKNAP